MAETKIKKIQLLFPVHYVQNSEELFARLHHGSTISFLQISLGGVLGALHCWQNTEPNFWSIVRMNCISVWEQEGSNLFGWLNLWLILLRRLQIMPDSYLSDEIPFGCALGLLICKNIWRQVDLRAKLVNSHHHRRCRSQKTRFFRYFGVWAVYVKTSDTTSHYFSKKANFVTFEHRKIDFVFRYYSVDFLVLLNYSVGCIVNYINLTK